MRWPNRMSWRSWPIRTGRFGSIGPASDARKWAESSNRPPRPRSGFWRAIWARRSRRIVLPSPAFCRAAANASKGLLPPLAERPVFTIRKRASIVFTLDDYVAKGILPAAGAEVIRRAVVDRKNILVAGGTGSGKTTLVNAILAEPPFKSDRIVLIEDTKELQCPAEDKVELLTKNTEPRVTMTDLLRMTLRLRPDRIIIGEVRGPEALAMLKAWNTGHPGGVATIHANSAADALRRIEDLVGKHRRSYPTDPSRQP